MHGFHTLKARGRGALLVDRSLAVAAVGALGSVGSVGALGSDGSVGTLGSDGALDAFA